MVVVLSPSKTMECRREASLETTDPFFTTQANKLLQALQQISAYDLLKLMHISEKLAIQTYERFQSLDLSSIDNNKLGHAVLTYTGDVYAGLQAKEWSKEEFIYAQSRLRIMSGLYGIVRPLDGIQPYRLEMGLSWKTPDKNSLYSFWSDLITDHLIQTQKESSSSYLLNLASDEYARCIQSGRMKTPIIEVSFFDIKNGKKTFLSFHAKRARGLMASYVIRHQLNTPEQLTSFQEEGYTFDKASSNEIHYTFIRQSLPSGK